MFFNALSYLLGLVIIQQLPRLPTFWLQCLLGLLLIALFIGYRLAVTYSAPSYLRLVIRMLVFAMLGVCWGLLSANHYLQHRLPESMASQDILVEGVIEGIPLEQSQVQRFVFKIERYVELADVVMPQRVRLSWYYGEKVNAGERWQFRLRMKPPHGMQNPGGFDYEAWLYQQGIHATGYVRKHDENKRLSQASWYSVDAVRQVVSQHIQQNLRLSAHVGILTALSVGDRAPIRPQQWEQLIRTGTNHLMAISGLHIGLAAGFGFLMLRRSLPVSCLRGIAIQHLALAGGLSLATFYALLAGLSVPTQRALIMLLCFALATLLRRQARPLDVLSLAMILVLSRDPVAILSAGFWFSFTAVAVIFYVFSGRTERANPWLQMGWLQLCLSLALFPLSLLLFQQASIVSPLANLFMVPFVSFIIVPLVLLSIILLPVSSGLSSYLLHVASYLLDWVWPLLSGLANSDYASRVQAVPSVSIACLGFMGIILLLAPRGIPARYLGLVMILPLFSQPPNRVDRGALMLDVLDVGQGLAVVVRTQKHTLVYDTGDQLGSRLDSGKAVLLPFLRHHGIDDLDRLVISHGDADHISGAASVIKAYPEVALSGQDIGRLVENTLTRQATVCEQGLSWHWDGVDFEFLHPESGQHYAERNNRSCVLLIRAAGGGILLTGDIEKTVEARLVADHSELLDVDILLVPHHGSKSSSSQAFVAAVSPDIAIFPVGYRNRYRLPSETVKQRYRQAGARLLSTGHAGALHIELLPGEGASLIDEYRLSHARYWHHDSPKLWQ